MKRQKVIGRITLSEYRKRLKHVQHHALLVAANLIRVTLVTHDSRYGTWKDVSPDAPALAHEIEKLAARIK
jgi:hypothetical protein